MGKVAKMSKILIKTLGIIASGIVSGAASTCTKAILEEQTATVETVKWGDQPEQPRIIVNIYGRGYVNTVKLVDSDLRQPIPRASFVFGSENDVDGFLKISGVDSSGQQKEFWVDKEILADTYLRKELNWNKSLEKFYEDTVHIEVKSLETGAGTEKAQK